MSRYVWPLAIALLCAVSAAAWAAGPAGLEAEWNFDEGEGNVARDATGHGHDARLYGPTWVKQGKGYAIRLDGFDDYVDAGESKALGIGGPFSLELWVKPLLKAHGEAKLLGEGYSTYVLTYYNTEICNFYVGGGATGNWKSAKLKVGEWNHVVAAFDGETLHQWVNGRPTSSRKSPNKNYKPAGHFHMGTKGSPQSAKFKGLMDRVRVYRRALSAEEAVAHFKAEAPEYGYDPTWFSRVKVTPYCYFDRGEVVVEADYQGLLPLKEKGRLEATLSRKDRPGETIARKVLDGVPGTGLAEVALPCEGLSPGQYLIRVALKVGKKAYPVEEVSFSYPPEPSPLPAPAEKTAGPLPPAPSPTPYKFRMAGGGGFVLTVNGADYPFRTRISWPNGDFNRLTPSDGPYGRGEKSWRVRVRQAGRDRYQVEAGGDFYRLLRQVEVFPTHVYVKDTYTNTTGEDLGLLIYNETPVRQGQVTDSRLSGYDRRGRQAHLPYPDYGPNAFFTDANAGMGIIPIDDVFVVQAVPYVEWQGAAGVCTEKFALPPGKSYTLEWAVYPTGSGDYYDFINTFRKVEDRIARVDGAVGYVTYGLRSRRQVVDPDFVSIRNMKIGICTNLAFPVDDPKLMIEGIEFVDFPQERALLRLQTTALHRRFPDLKLIFHIAHSLYCTNDPDRFADSKVINADGTQARWGDGTTYFGEERGKAGWQFWIFYPTPGNSFHDAMMRSVDVMMDEMGFDGGFMDGFLAGYISQWSYDTDLRWDGHSAEIDLRTKAIRRKVNSVLLLSQPSMIAYARKIRDKGGVVVAMHTVFTRTIANEKYIIYANECATGPELHLAPSLLVLSSPNLKNEKGLYLDMLDKLNWGELFLYYSEPTFFSGLTYPPLASREFPITFEEIRSGLVRGKERIVTKNSGVYGWPGDPRLHAVYKYDARGVPVPNDFLTTVDRGEVRTELRFRKNESAVIVPLPVTLESDTPVNVRVLRYDDSGLRALLSGRGPATLKAFMGTYNRPKYRVSIGGTATTMTPGEDGLLVVPLKLDGQVEVVLERARGG